MLATLLTLALTAFPAKSAEVAFIEYHNEFGQPVQLEPDGRFMHVAIRVGGFWFHAHTHEGVALVESLEKYGHRIVRLEHPGVPDPTPLQVLKWLGKPFDYTYDWRHPHATYCSRLVAEILKIEPRPMSFSAEHWRQSHHKPEGHLGLSPDDLYEILQARGFKPARRDCEDFLARKVN